MIVYRLLFLSYVERLCKPLWLHNYGVCFYFEATNYRHLTSCSQNCSSVKDDVWKKGNLLSYMGLAHSAHHHTKCLTFTLKKWIGQAEHVQNAIKSRLVGCWWSTPFEYQRLIAILEPEMLTACLWNVMQFMKHFLNVIWGNWYLANILVNVCSKFQSTAQSR